MESAPDQAVLQVQEAAVTSLLHLADAHQPALPALMPPPHTLDVGRRSLQLGVPLQPLPCNVTPASIIVCSYFNHACWTYARDVFPDLPLRWHWHLLVKVHGNQQAARQVYT